MSEQETLELIDMCLKLPENCEVCRVKNGCDIKGEDCLLLQIGDLANEIQEETNQ